MPPEELAPGATATGPTSAVPPLVAGRWRAVRPLGGAGGDAWLAEAEGGRAVVLRAPAAAGVAAADRALLQHATAALSTLRSPHVAQPLHCSVEGARLVSVRAFVAGETLAARLERGRLAAGEAVAVARGIFAGLRDAHDRGVLHRRLKPSNVVLDEGRAVLVDFCAARARDGGLLDARYMAPESAGLVDEPVREPADLYAAGAIVYECLGGRPPFGGAELGEVLRQHATARPAPLRSLGVAVPRALDELLSRLLAKDPRERMQSAAAALADLDAIAAGLADGVAEPAVVVGLRDRRRTLAEPSFVGRGEELALVDELARRARAGEGGVLAIEGRAGAGKTRLLEEVALRLAPRGARVLRGQAQDGAAAEPFALFAGVAQGLAAAMAADAAFSAAVRARLGELAASLSGAPPALLAALGVPRASEAGSVEAWAALLAAAGTPERPSAILLDDAQWASPPALAALARFEARPGPRHAFVALTFAAEPVGASHPLRALPGAIHLELGPLAAREARLLAESMAGPLPDAAADALARLAEGTPFMLTAVLRGLVESGALQAGAEGWHVDERALADVSSSRQSAALLGRRLELLPAPARVLLAAAAVLGRAFDPVRAGALAGLAPAAAGAWLDEARRRSLAWPRPDGSWAFVHGAVRDAALAATPPAERERLHRLAAAQLEASTAAGAPPAQVSLELADHFDAAGEPERALQPALAAAEHARAHGALDVAERYYRVAERGAAGASPAERLRIADGLAEVLLRRGHYAEAAARLDGAEGLAGDAASRAMVAARRGELSFKQGDARRAVVELERALDLCEVRIPRDGGALYLVVAWEVVVALAVMAWRRLLPARREASPRDQLVARACRWLSHAAWLDRGAGRALWAALRGRNLAERRAPTPDLAALVATFAPAFATFGLHRAALRAARRALALRRAHRDAWGEGQALYLEGAALYAAGRHAECVRCCEQAVQLLERDGDRWETHAALYHLALARYRLGELREAAETARHLERSAQEVGDAAGVAHALAVLARATGGRVPADAVEAALRGSPDAQSATELLLAEGLRRLSQGRPGDAAAVLADAAHRARKSHQHGVYVSNVPAWLAVALRQEAERLSPLAAGRRRALLSAADAAVRRAAFAALRFPGLRPFVLRERALLAAHRDRTARARRLLDRSLEVAGRQRARYEAARTRLARGQLGALLGWPGAAEDAASARGELRRLGATLEPSDGGEAQAPMAVSPSLVDRFDSVLDAGRHLASALSRPAVFGAVREAALGLLRGEACLVLEVDPRAGRRLVPASVADVPDAHALALAERALDTGRSAVFSADHPAWGSDADLAEPEGARAGLAVPIAVRGRAVACFVVVHRTLPGLFNEEARRLGEFIAAIAGAALENAQGFAELREAHEDLRLQKTLLEARDAVAVEGILVAAQDGRVLSVNRRFLELWGLPPDFGPGRSAREAVRRAAGLVEDPATWLARVRRLGRDFETRGRAEVRLRDGRVLERYTAPVTSDDGVVYGRAWFYRDVTEQRLAERRTAAAHAITRALSEAPGIAEAAPRVLAALGALHRFEAATLWIADRERDMLRCAGFWRAEGLAAAELEAASRATAYAPGKDVVGRVWSTGEPVWLDLEDSPDYARLPLAYLAGLRGGLFFPVSGDDGGWGVLELLSAGVRPPEPELMTMLASVSLQLAQYLARKFAEDARASLAYTNAIIEASLDPFITVGPDGSLIDVNEAFERATGYPREELLYSDFAAFFAIPDAARAAVREAFERGRVEGRALAVRHKEGKTMDVSFNATVFRDATGQVQGVFAAARDVTEKARMEKELALRAEELARSNEDLEKFAYVASHDLQEPLRMVESYLTLLAQRYAGKLDRDADEFIGFAVDGAERMRALIKGLLAWSRAGAAPRLEPTDCVVVVASSLDNLKAAIGDAKAKVEVGAMPTVLGDATQLAQLFQNLVGNAVKFASKSPSPLVTVSAERAGDLWHFTVSDNGVGFDPSQLDRLFVMFQRLHRRSDYPGAGIGLALCKRIVERHGGKIWAEARAAGGASFHFTLRAVEEKPV